MERRFLNTGTYHRLSGGTSQTLAKFERVNERIKKLSLPLSLVILNLACKRQYLNPYGQLHLN